MIKLLLILVVLTASLSVSVGRMEGQTIPQPGAYLPYIAVPLPTTTPTATATPTTTPTPTATPLRFVCSHDFYNCGDFLVGSDAQEVFMYCMAVVGFDIHKLDQNNDSIACNALWP